MLVVQYWILLTWIGFSKGYIGFSLTSCGTNVNPLVSIRGSVEEYPIQIPGHVRASGTVHIHRPVRAGHLRLDVTVQKWIVFDYFTLPCVSKVGSCSYDACNLLGWFEDRGCPWQLTFSNFPCTCPFTNGTYTLDPHPFYIPRTQNPWRWLAYGDFRVTGRLIDTDLAEEVACYTVEFTVQAKRPNNYWSYGGWW